MNRSLLMTIATISYCLFGIGFLLAPAQVSGLFGYTQATPGLLETTQFLGAALIGLGIINASARNAADSEAMRAILLGNFVGNTAGLIVAVVGQLNGTTNALGWLGVAFYVLFTVGFGYYRFTPRTTATITETRAA